MFMSIPWVELWRPTKIMDIILDPINKDIMNNIINSGYFPNLLIYGPPGVGKTSSVIALVNEYQEKHNYKTKSLVIQNNASEDRGVDIIRNQISQFVNSKPLFNEGMKFIILDEADYMTKNAQQALRYLLQEYSSHVRFCLICNYISRIDDGLQNEFLKLRFNQLPEKDIHNFLTHISLKENLNISQEVIVSIQKLYKSDIRSMINYMQTNQDSFNKNFNIINDTVLENIYDNLTENIQTIMSLIKNISIKYNIDNKNIIKNFLNYIIRNHSKYLNTNFLNFVENVMHSQIQNNNIFVNYSLSKLSFLLSSL